MNQALRALLTRANTHAMGYVGLLVGGAAIVIPPVAALFTLLSDPTYLVQLAHALERAYLAIRLHAPLGDGDQLVLAQLVGSLISVFGGFVIALLCAYYGKPKTISDTPSTAPSSPTNT